MAIAMMFPSGRRIIPLPAPALASVTSFRDINRFRQLSPIDALVVSSDETEERFYRADLFNVSVGRNGYQDAGVEREGLNIEAKSG